VQGMSGGGEGEVWVGAGWRTGFNRGIGRWEAEVGKMGVQKALVALVCANLMLSAFVGGFIVSESLHVRSCKLCQAATIS
jgi:hypothetical protein